MTNPTPRPQSPIEPEENVSGLGSSERLSDVGKVEKKESIPLDAPTHQKRQRYDSEGHPLISKGFLIRADIDRKYSIKATILHAKKYELVNDALLYYYEHVLQKTGSQKLKEAGQEELDI
jgi:hypothetical protein